MNNSNTKLIDRVKKILAKAKSTDSEQEADTCFAIAYNLLAQNNLSLADVKQEEETSTTSSSHCVEYGQKSDEGQWESSLLAVLCKYNMCQSIIHPIDKTMSIIGTPSNNEITIYMYGFIRDMIRARSRKRWSEFRKETLKNHPGKTEKELRKAKILPWDDTWKRSYLKGSVIGLHMKLKKEREKIVATKLNAVQSNSTTSLVLLEKNQLDENKKYMEQNYSNLESAKKQRRPSNHQASHLGYKDGREIELKKAISKK